MEQVEAGGDALELAKFLFNENKPPGRVALDVEGTFGGADEQFRFLCDLYITGAKLFNGLEPADEFESLELIRKSTGTFLAERMAAALSVQPTLAPMDHGEPEGSPRRYRFASDAQALENNMLDDLKLNTRLTMRFVYA
jgi:hypothetical protein